MEKSGKQMILNCEKLERRFAMLNDGRLEEYQIEREDSGPKVGNIYLGRIINLEPSLQAAFIDIGAEKNAFLHYHEMLPGGDELLEKRISEEEAEEAEEAAARNTGADAPIAAKRRKRQEAHPGSRALSEALRRKKKLTVADIPEFFKPGMELLVQVVKSPIGTKGARVTTNMSIPGRYLVLMPYSEHIGLSTRIEGAQERDRLRKILSSLELPEGMGLICRTAGEGRKAAFFKRDLDLLLDYWRKIEHAMETQKAPAEVFTEPNLVARTIRDFMTEEIYRNLVCSIDASAPESVHLCDFPSVNESWIDKKLEEDMAEVLKIVVMGRACRNTAAIKNRQPIGTMFVKADKPLSDFYQEIIEDELNVKKVVFTSDVRDFTTYTFKPQLRTVGPKYGKQLGAIRGYLEKLDGNAAMDELEAAGALKFTAGDTQVELTKDDLLIEMSQKPGYVSEADNAMTVVLDTNLTDELVEEGFVYEVISKIQTMRKDAGFEVMDLIRVSVCNNEKIAGIVKDNEPVIAGKVLADSITADEPMEISKEWNVNGQTVVIGVQKVK